MLILGIETSCDETAAAVVKVIEDEKNPSFEVLSNIVSSQVEMHAKFGGVVPNLAAREHAKNIVPVLEEALSTASVGKDNIDLIAVTRGPGLIPALLVGTSAAKTLAYAWKKPIVGVNHIEGHIYANCCAAPSEVSRSETKNGTAIGLAKTKNCLQFPALALIVSGGHTELVLMRDHGNFELVGKTRDDAVGEAFDKAARLLDLGYPGGPAISQAAEQGTPGIFTLPRPMISSGDFDFSFSGIKTAVRTIVQNTVETPSFAETMAGKQNFASLQKNNIAAEFQQAVIDVLIHKTYKAIEHFHPKTVILAGGVAANKALREQLKNKINSESPNTKYLIPNTQFCTDNAAMIAVAGYFHKNEATMIPWEVETDANIVIAEK